MIIRILKTGDETEVNDNYGERMIEQGQAVLVKAEKPSEKEPDASASDPEKLKKRRRD